MRNTLAEIDSLATARAYPELCDHIVIVQSESTALTEAERLATLTGARLEQWKKECARLLREAAAAQVHGVVRNIHINGAKATAQYASHVSTELVHLVLVRRQWRLVIPVDPVG